MFVMLLFDISRYIYLYIIKELQNVEKLQISWEFIKMLYKEKKFPHFYIVCVWLSG